MLCQELSSQPIGAFSKPLLIATTRCIWQPLVVASNKWLLNVTSGCEQGMVARTARGRFFFKVGIISIDVETWERKGTIEFLYTRVI